MIKKVYVEKNRYGFSFIYSNRNMDYPIGITDLPLRHARAVAKFLIQFDDCVLIGKKRVLKELDIPEAYKVEIDF